MQITKFRVSPFLQFPEFCLFVFMLCSTFIYIIFPKGKYTRYCFSSFTTEISNWITCKWQIRITEWQNWTLIWVSGFQALFLFYTGFDQSIGATPCFLPLIHSINMLSPGYDIFSINRGRVGPRQNDICIIPLEPRNNFAFLDVLTLGTKHLSWGSGLPLTLAGGRNYFLRHV